MGVRNVTTAAACSAAELTSKSALNMSSDSVNMSGADGFFGFGPETHRDTGDVKDGTGRSSGSWCRTYSAEISHTARLDTSQD